MGSFKGEGREQGRPGRRRGPSGRGRPVAPNFEWLEGRALLAIGDGLRPQQPTSPDLADVQNGPLSNTGQVLISIYQEYQTYLRNGGNGPFVSRLADRVFFQGANVGVDISATGDLNDYLT